MLKKAQKRIGMNDFQYHVLRDVLNIEGDRIKDFIEKYKEVRVQISRGKIANAQYSTSNNGESPLNTMFMGKDSLSRRGQEARDKRESITR